MVNLATSSLNAGCSLASKALGIMKKNIQWPEEEFTLQDLIGLNPQFDSLTLHFLVNRKLSDGSLIKTKQDGCFRLNQR
jgi:hypothetical protein